LRPQPFFLPTGQTLAFFRQLLPDLRCALFGRPERPAFCVSLRPSLEMCGSGREEAMAFLATLERLTGPVM